MLKGGHVDRKARDGGWTDEGASLRRADGKEYVR